MENDIWDENHQLKPDFSYEGIATSGLRDIILLHDWYACNAPNKTYSDMGFKDDDEFMNFRKRCNKIAYNLRKNHYAKMLSMEKVKLQDIVNDLTDKLGNRHNLKFHDKYGFDAKKDEGEKKWSIDDVTKD